MQTDMKMSSLPDTDCRTKDTRRQIVVVGYPKSGNTWLTRLTAELIGCPANGYLTSDHNDFAKEGTERSSDYSCFKSHHQLHELEKEVNLDESHVIYVVRDPRDVAVSGASYFRIKPAGLVGAVVGCVPMGPNLYGSISKAISPESYRIKHTVQAILHGSDRVHHWCRIPWKQHYMPYWERGVLFVQFEDLLNSPETQCKRILDYVGLERSDEQIEEAVGSQSFAKRKVEFSEDGEWRKARFMRKGKSEQWKQKLTNQQRSEFIELLGEDLTRFSYEAES